MEKLTATTSLLKLIKLGYHLESNVSSYVHRSATSRKIKAFCRPRMEAKTFPLTKQGLTDALEFAFHYSSPNRNASE